MPTASSLGTLVSKAQLSVQMRPLVHDERDRLIARTDPSGPYISPGGPTIQYTYEDASNRTSVQTPNGTTTYGFDAQNRLISNVKLLASRDNQKTDQPLNLNRIIWRTLPLR